MGDKTDVSWSGATWNPWYGCRKKSPGCKLCYMYREQLQYGGRPSEVILARDATFGRPLRWAVDARAGKRTGSDRTVFTCSWSDWNNPEADDWRADAWDIIRRTIPDLNYLILTKLPERFPETLPPDWGDGWEGVGLGTSVESADYSWRAAALGTVPAWMRFLSIEPCLDRADWFPDNCDGIDWAILGGESDHHNARPFDCTAVDPFLSTCAAAGIAAHVKQVGSNPTWNISMGSDWKGGDWSTWPRHWWVRDFPAGWPTPDPIFEQQKLF